MSDQATENSPSTIVTSSSQPHERRRRRCQIIITDNVFWSVFMGLMPLPIIDTMAVSAIQLKMVNELAHEYDQRFSRHRSKAIILALLAGLSSVELTRISLGVAKWIPGPGSLPVAAHVGLMAGAVTYGVGQVFVDHLEAGGELEDLDPAQHQDHFRLMVDEGQSVIRRLGKSRAR